MSEAIDGSAAHARQASSSAILVLAARQPLIEKHSIEASFLPLSQHEGTP